MDTANFLVIESDQGRADAVMSALHFLGYRPQLDSELSEQDANEQEWRAVYVGQVVDDNKLRRRLDTLGQQGAGSIPLLLAADSPQSSRLAGNDSPFAGCVERLQFPLRYEQVAEAMRSLHARQISAAQGRARFVGRSSPMARVNALIRQVAPFDSSVLVLGESGTGKEMVARTIHECSPRRDKPFVAINCGAIPAELLESELFG
ncbi:MAG TPA: sigma 54-interacting transcriptional regulator, partial [Dyella sp.]|uniref:sigma 54-interacting transcriptional regulator n=1 Tax=Dyella sp. TaxID=1869338 RepID=UPI002F93A614